MFNWRTFLRLFWVCIGPLFVAWTKAHAIERADVQIFGDVYVNQRMLEVTKSDTKNPRLFAGVSDLIESSSLDIANFEGVATKIDQPLDTQKQFLLRVPVTVPMILRNGGIDAVTLANNHSLDFGFQGLQDTIRLLIEADLHYAGAGANKAQALVPMRFQLVGDKKICVLSFSRTLPQSFWATKDKPGTAYASLPEVVSEVKNCAQGGYFTIPIFHWGQELTRTPLEYQRELARAAIDAGAPIVIGHHPHLIQDIEIYRGRLILYSTGNFLFGTDPKHHIPEGMAVRLRLSTGAEARNFAVDLVPLVVRNDRVGYVTRISDNDEDDYIKPRLPEKHPCREVRSTETTTRHWTCLVK